MNSIIEICRDMDNHGGFPGPHIRICNAMLNRGAL